MKNKVLTLVIVLMAGLSSAYGEGTEASLLRRMDKAEEATLDKIAIERTEEETTHPPSVETKPSQMAMLLREVESLKDEVVVSRSIGQASQSPRDRKRIGAKTYFVYKEGAIYEIHLGFDNVTDIELGRGEHLSGTPVSGDTVRWKLSVFQSGVGSEERTHLVLKPLEENLETNLIVATDKRVYHIRALSGNWYMPAVAWNYPDEEAKAIEETIKKKEEVEEILVPLDKLNYGYRIKGGEKSWAPVRVFDDGRKTYLEMPANISSFEAPTLFLLDESGETQMVMYRKWGPYYVVDRLFMKAQMRIGPTDKVDIVAESKRSTIWERLF